MNVSSMLYCHINQIFGRNILKKSIITTTIWIDTIWKEREQSNSSEIYVEVANCHTF